METETLCLVTEKVPLVMEGTTKRFHLVKHSLMAQPWTGGSTSVSDKKQLRRTLSETVLQLIKQPCAQIQGADGLRITPTTTGCGLFT